MLTKSQLHELYYWLLLNRTLEDRIISLYRTGKIFGNVYTGRGQEAISVGTAYALGKNDIIAPMLRNTGSFLVRGFTPEEILAQYMGKSTSPTGGRDCGLNMGDLRRGIVAPIAVLGTLVPVVAGVAIAAKIRKLGVVALTYIGDGGASTTDFHEGLNLAAVCRAPMILVLENNGWAFSTPTRMQTASTNFITRASAYGISGAEVDGNDVVEVYEATRRVLEEVRAGQGTALIVANTMRMGGDSGHDDAWYVPKDEIEKWKSKDPIRRFEKYLTEGGLITPKERDEVVTRVRTEVDDATASASKSPFPEGIQALGGVYRES
jgi:TPP-dependent pyruvate/acetoin dehydrogenase alpha subunit